MTSEMFTMKWKHTHQEVQNGGLRKLERNMKYQKLCKKKCNELHSHALVINCD